MNRTLLVLFFWASLIVLVPTSESFNLKSRLSATDQHHVHQLNQIRSYVGSGWLREVFGEAIEWILHIWDTAKVIVKGVIEAWLKVKKFFSNVGSWLGLKRHRRRDPDARFSEDNSGKSINAHKPLLGPAAKMNELRWNKRLSQLVYAKMEDLTAGVGYEYNGKMYRAFEHGSLFESCMNDFFPILSSIFDALKAVWVCAQLLFSRVTNGSAKESEVKNEIFEYLFDYYEEVGCGTNGIGSWCLIGPLNEKAVKQKGSIESLQLMEEGETCGKCSTKCTEGMCEASPDFVDQARLRKIMEGEIEVEEVIVEEVTVLPPELEVSNAHNLNTIECFILSLFFARH
ncbi:unnamed protein product [Caenorhabditis sp. 36 PRJEB53466]|nr:unnamed protein product [Caenorhabditis sp. 36 PRJEB53466]